MIIRNRPSGLRLFLIMRGSVVPRIRTVLFVNIAVAILVTALHGMLFDYKITLTAIPFTLMGLTLAIFLGFRNSVAYDRFWEGRKLWGQILSESRVLARQCASLFHGPDFPPGPAPAAVSSPPSGRVGAAGPGGLRARMIHRAIAFAHALRQHLRDQDDIAQYAALLAPDERAGLQRSANRPDYLMLRMGDDLRDALAAGRIDIFLAPALDRTFTRLTELAAACERIHTTPIPFSYTLLLHRTAYLYCFLLPFGLVDTIGNMTPIVVAIIAYTFFGLDALGDEIEEPFGLAANDLPLDTICRTIEINLREALGESDIPPPLRPVDFCLT